MSWAALTAAHGKNSRVTVGSGPTILKATDWDYTHEADDGDLTNSESTGCEEGNTGIQRVSWNIKGKWDLKLNPEVDPPGFYPRNDLASVKFIPSNPDVATVTPMILALARVLSVRATMNVRQNIEYAASGKSQGPFTLPSGSLS